MSLISDWLTLRSTNDCESYRNSFKFDKSSQDKLSKQIDLRSHTNRLPFRLNVCPGHSLLAVCSDLMSQTGCFVVHPWQWMIILCFSALLFLVPSALFREREGEREKERERAVRKLNPFITSVYFRPAVNCFSIALSTSLEGFETQKSYSDRETLCWRSLQTLQMFATNEREDQ